MQVVDGRITSAAAAQSRFDVRTINQRVLVDVAAAAAFGDACGLRWGDEGEGGAVVLSVLMKLGLQWEWAGGTSIPDSGG